MSKKTSNVREGQRNSSLFLECLRLASTIADQLGHTEEAYDQLLSSILQFNENICTPPLGGAEVKATCRRAWEEYELKGKNFKRKRKRSPDANLRVHRKFVLKTKDNPYAYNLLLWLAAHNEMDASFPINDAGLRRYLGWSGYRLAKAKAYLVDEEYVEQITTHVRIPGTAGLSANYNFTDKASKRIKRIKPIKKNDNS